MRTLFFALAVLTLAPLAHAQNANPNYVAPAPAPVSQGVTVAAPPPPAPTVENDPHVAAARDLMQAYLVDSGMFDTAIGMATDRLVPMMRSELTHLQGFDHISHAHREALLHYVDSMPSLLHDEFDRILPRVLTDSAPDVANMFTQDELNDITTFLHDPGTQTLLRRLFQLAAGSQAMARDNFSPEELRGLEAFLRTPAGRAFNRHVRDLTKTVSATLNVAVEQETPAFRSRVEHDVCALLEDECPQSLRHVTTT